MLNMDILPLSFIVYDRTSRSEQDKIMLTFYLFILDLMFAFGLFISSVLIIIFFPSAETVCPSYGNDGSADRNSCFDQCSPEKDQCKSNTKCCFFLTHPCGHRCIIPKDDKPKFGKCPPPHCNQMDLLWSVCDIRLCDVDDDCPNDQKCCSNSCNTRMCLTPQQSRRKRRFFF
jgi:hypothetical protein